ncbi:MAG: protein-methionine-sulfoxide reductase catalytic subunit MsrP [Nitrospinaceae bacterium]
MASILLKKPWEIAGSMVTPETVVMRRREFLKGTALTGLATAALLTGCSPPRSDPDAPLELFGIEKKVFPAKRNDSFQLDRDLTAERVAASYNNFYEFSEVKEDVRIHAQALTTRPWTVEVTGLVHKPQTFDTDDLLRTMPIEERLYRLRCVEAWAMAVPWTGFPFKALLNEVQPLSRATHVRMTTFYKPFTAQGQLAFWHPWPYTEGLTLAEAMNDLAFLAVGIYGHPLPKQHGAPIRLVVPWKYGFKSIKSIVRIELVDYRPATFWNTVQGLEYDFTANVDPRVRHPRWSQAREKMIGTGEVRPTLLYNGYGEQVARLYD